MSKANILVLSVLAASLNHMLPPNSEGKFFPMDGPRIGEALIAAGGVWLGPRGILEDNVLFRQLIPYVVLKKGDKFVCYKRTNKGGEDRLHDLFSIGWGGHVEIPDVKLQYGQIQVMATLEANAARELSEELPGLGDVVSKSWAGLLVDNSNLVGQVHVGVVMIWEVDALPGDSDSDGLTDQPEDCIANVQLVDSDELFAMRPNLESWSRMLVEHWDAAAQPLPPV